ncbi:MAG: TAXI family TRAP transporter solute-binding subunit [candidate division NC10 bacterium]
MRAIVGGLELPRGYAMGIQDEGHAVKKRIIPAVLALGVAVGSAGVPAPAHAAKKFFVIGGGSKTGIYYQVALGVCTLVNEKLGSQGYTCKGQEALGSVLNIKAMRQGLLDFAVIQSDLHWQAYNGEEDWKGKPYKELRSLFSIYRETVMLVTRADTGITSVTDLRGKRVNIGNPGSGHRENAEDILRIYGIERYTDISERELEAQDAARALLRGKIDAFFYTVGNPWERGQKIANRIKIRMIPINAPGIKDLVASHPYYVMAAIPGGIYKGVDKDVPTYAVKATFVTGASEPEEVVYNVVKTVFENLDRFRRMHAAFKSLEPKDMLKGLSAPLHPGAVRYYKEKGWM